MLSRWGLNQFASAQGAGEACANCTGQDGNPILEEGFQKSGRLEAGRWGRQDEGAVRRVQVCVWGGDWAFCLAEDVGSLNTTCLLSPHIL